MNWKDIKDTIIADLNNTERGLANPSIRTSALTNIENMLGKLIQANPSLLHKIGKEDLLKSLSKLKKLNSAEKSIVNHIFSVLEGSVIPIKKRKTPLSQV